MKFLGLPSRLWLLSACTLLAAPLAVGTLYFTPPGAFGCLILYYFFAETWFAVLFTVIVEIVGPEVRIIFCKIFIIDLLSGSLNLHCYLLVPDEPGGRKPPCNSVSFTQLFQ